MRFYILALAFFSIGSLVAAAYTSRSVTNYLNYANVVSKNHAKGDNGDASGWRDCVEMENDGGNVGVACEGGRGIFVHGGRMVDVNYFCEFRFQRLESQAYRVEMELCQ
ncbi:MAG TPA: hypothetical protein PKC28_15650 [Bdellovibrionales bacterium]|nr:hypothetical protein [Bdellovibrionales bacterium]